MEFARALAAQPRLLLLDEVLCGLNPTEVDHAVEMIRKIRSSGTTIVFVEHLMRAVVALADRVAVLDQGRLLALGDPDGPCATRRSSGSIWETAMLLEVRNIEVGYGDATALWDASIQIEAGRSSRSSGRTARARARW